MKILTNKKRKGGGSLKTRGEVVREKKRGRE